MTVKTNWLLLILTIVHDVTNSCQNGTMYYSSTGRYLTNVTQCVYPSNEQEIISLIQMSAESGASVRAIGRSHSYSGASMMDKGTTKRDLFLINMSVHMNNIIEINEEENTMTFEGGCSIYQVVTALSNYNLTIPDYGGPPGLNFIGAMMTGTHTKASQRKPHKTLASNVIHLRMVISNGTVIEANNTFNKDIFNAARISFGSLGIITQIKVHLIPMYYATYYPSIVLNNMDNINTIKQTIEQNVSDILNNYDSVYGGLRLFNELMSFSVRKNVIDYSNKSDPNVYNNTCWNLGGLPCTDLHYKAWYGAPNWNIPRYLPLINEFFISEHIWMDALKGVIEWIYQQKYSQLWNDTYDTYLIDNNNDIRITIRWVGHDDIWLSPSYHGNVMQITLESNLRLNSDVYDANNIYDRWLNGIHKYLKDNFSPVTYHWGKMSLSTVCDLQASYPKLDDFKKLREELDPINMFVNKFISDKLGLCDIEKVNDCCCTNSTCTAYVDQQTETDLWQEYNIWFITGL
eukprot:260732_1